MKGAGIPLGIPDATDWNRTPGGEKTSKYPLPDWDFPDWGLQPRLRNGDNSGGYLNALSLSIHLAEATMSPIAHYPMPLSLPYAA